MSALLGTITHPVRKSRVNWPWRLLVLLIFLVVLAFVLSFTIQLFTHFRLEDFANTFYPAGKYLLRGENVFLNSYPHPTNDRQYPPYSPIWILYSTLPLSVLPLPVAEALRLLFDVAMLPFLAYLCTRWAHVENVWLGGLLVLAPWHLTEISTGQWTVLVFIGIFLCYWAARQASPVMMAVGLWLVLVKPNIVTLIILASVLFAWRGRILSKMLVILGALVAIGSLGQPDWVPSLVKLYLDRLAHPRPADSILLLPGYPWSQLVLVTVCGLCLIVYIRRSKVTQPTPWLWAMLLCVSLVGALHTFVYDWQLLMLPLALLMRRRWGVLLALALYSYSILWAILELGLEVPLPSPAILPGIVLLAMLLSRIQRKVLPQLMTGQAVTCDAENDLA